MSVAGHRLVFWLVSMALLAGCTKPPLPVAEMRAALQEIAPALDEIAAYMSAESVDAIYATRRQGVYEVIYSDGRVTESEKAIEPILPHLLRASVASARRPYPAVISIDVEFRFLSASESTVVGYFAKGPVPAHLEDCRDVRVTDLRFSCVVDGQPWWFGFYGGA